MVLNALNYDPGKIWKGPWRWISEETLQCEFPHVCGHSLERVKDFGMNFSEFESLARCHGVRIHSYRASDDEKEAATDQGVAVSGNDRKEQQQGVARFRDAVASSTSSSLADQFVVVNFSRKVLGQTGGGHFSPIGGFHAAKDLVLVMDVARFKYPPYWVPLVDLWKAMTQVDDLTGETRGYFVIEQQQQQQQQTSGSDSERKGTTCCSHEHPHHHHHN